MADEHLSTAGAIDALMNLDDGDDAPAQAESAPQPPKKKTPVPAAEPEVEAATEDLEADTEIETEAEPESAASDDDDQGEPNEASAEDDADAEQPEPELPAIEAPQFLDPTERETFKTLPRAAQELLLKHDKSLVADYTRKTQETATLRKAADQRLKLLGEVITEREDRIRQWREWEEKVAPTLAAENPADYIANKAQMDLEVREYNALQQKRSLADNDVLREHDAHQVKRITELAPHLAGETGAARRNEIIGYAIKAFQADGVDPDEINWRARRISATEMAVLDKALKWDAHEAAQKKLKDQPKPKLTPKPDAKSTGKVIRPAARQAPSNQVNQALRVAKKAPTQQNVMRALEDFD